MKFGLKFAFITLFSLFSYNLNAQDIVLKKGTIVPVRLAQNVNGNIDRQGDTVHFEVLGDIAVNGHVVINKGAFVNGKIVSAEGRKSMGKAGSISLEPRSVTSVDGQLVEFERERLSSEGRKRTGATVAHVIMWGPVGLFAKGRAARIMLDTEYDLEVDSDVSISPNIQTSVAHTDIHHQDVDVYFAKYKGKINFAKGKIGKDFKLHINLPQSTNLQLKDVEIIEVNNYDLPKKLFPVKLIWNQKTNDYVATFSFRSLVKYIVPNSVDVKVLIHSGRSNDALIGQTTLKTRWKLK